MKRTRSEGQEVRYSVFVVLQSKLLLNSNFWDLTSRFVVWALGIEDGDLLTSRLVDFSKIVKS
jgi:hypothetical protein